MSMNVSINFFVRSTPGIQCAATFGPKIFQAIFSPATYRPERGIKVNQVLYSFAYMYMHAF